MIDLCYCYKATVISVSKSLIIITSSKMNKELAGVDTIIPFLVSGSKRLPGKLGLDQLS
jgi:hypothetical protein